LYIFSRNLEVIAKLTIFTIKRKKAKWRGEKESLEMIVIMFHVPLFSRGFVKEVAACQLGRINHGTARILL